MPRPQACDFPEYYARYISRVDTDSIAEAVRKYAADLENFYTTLPDSKADYAYAAGKWTLKEVLQHVIDTERIMTYRMLRIARNDQTPLPSFDENSYTENARANERSFEELKEELKAVRRSSDLLIKSLSEEQLSSTGTASNLPVTANAVGYIVFGHLLHHKAIIEERYL
jgi:uncharacterized damage-inducible protein DinB